MKNITSKSFEVGGRAITFEIGKLAPRTTSAVLAKYGETTVLVTVVLGNEDLRKDYFPLSVEYQERLYAGGRIKGSRWVKREGRPTDAEVLSARLIDRSIRPLFPKGFKREVQVVITVLSTDSQNDADVLGINAVSAALALSPIPWDGPVGAVRMGLLDGKPVVNPQNGTKQKGDLDLVVTTGAELITMIEAGARQVDPDLVYSALEVAHAEGQAITKAISEFVSEVGVNKLPHEAKLRDPELVKKIETVAARIVADALDSVAGQPILEREMAYEIAKQNVLADFPDDDPNLVKELIEEVFHTTFRKNILEKQIRADGRKLDQIRPLSIEAGLIPRVHGSALFQRGETQALTITTLGAPSQYQSLESAEGEEQKRYMHHYNFPPFSTGETGKMGGLGRREIGHGALAERALSAVIPAEDKFPYAIRVVSEILSSNGSTSMASTCGSTLSLMDAGVPILAPVSGISIGLITAEDYPANPSKYVLLTDINGGEDHHGDMDFKIAGTKTGITAIQLDVKVPGLTLEICKKTFAANYVARMEILSQMLAVLDKPRAEISKYAPQISTLTIPVEKIGELIGPGGKVIKKLMADTETTIDVRDDGYVFISGLDAVKTAQAVAWISSLTKEVVAGEIYEGTVARLQPFGAFVNILPGKDGLVHVSQMTPGFVADPSEIVQEGQKVKVWVIEVDSQNRINLSMLFDGDGKPMAKERDSSPPPARSHFSAPVRSSDRRSSGGNRGRY